jgi:hypothetical protein
VFFCPIYQTRAVKTWVPDRSSYLASCCDRCSFVGDDSAVTDGLLLVDIDLQALVCVQLAFQWRR